MAWVFTSGTMAETMRENTKMTRSMAMASTSGLMAASTTGGGTKASSMVLDSINRQNKTK